MSILGKAPAISSGERTAVTSTVAHLYAGEDPRPWISWDRLADDEQQEIVGLVDALRQSGSLDRLSTRDRKRFEALVERGAGFEAGHFQRRRDAAAAARKTAERDAKKRRLGLGREADRSLFEMLHEAISREDIWSADATLIVLMVAMWSTGKPFSPLTSWFEGSGADAVLVGDLNLGLFGRADSDGVLGGARDRLAFLAKEGYFEIERSGPRVRIALGQRLRDAVDLVPYTPAAEDVLPELIG